MNAKDIMSNDAKVCAPEDALSRAAQIMWENDCGFVPVLDGSRRLMGVLTDRDICMAAYTRGLPLEAIPARSTMSSQLRTCKPDDTAEVVAEMMRTQQVRRIPVVNSQGQLVGIVALSDLALLAERPTGFGSRHVFDKHRLADTLSGISSPTTANHAAAYSS